MKEKLAASVILYNPQPSTWKNIMTYLPFVDKLYVLDNSSQSYENELIAAVKDANKIEYLSKNENLGISIQLNIACKKAMADGYDWLLTMDQDSYFDLEKMEEYLNCITSFPHFEKIGIFGFVQTKEPQAIGCTFDYTLNLITSGSIVNLTAYKETQGFDEQLFIDAVDQDFCYQCVQLGYKLVKFKNIVFHHSLGEVKNFRSLKSGKMTSRSLHSPIRLYYMIRNFKYMQKKYPEQEFAQDILATKKDIYIRIKNNLLYGNQRMQVLKSIQKAFADFRNNKMGKA